jgi:hypothetical protein
MPPARGPATREGLLQIPLAAVGMVSPWLGKWLTAYDLDFGSGGPVRFDLPSPSSSGARPTEAELLGHRLTVAAWRPSGVL